MVASSYGGPSSNISTAKMTPLLDCTRQYLKLTHRCGFLRKVSGP